MSDERVDRALKSVLPTRQRSSKGWLYGVWAHYDFLPSRSRSTSSAERRAAQQMAAGLAQHHRRQLVDMALGHLPPSARAEDCEVRTLGTAESGQVLVIVECRA